jgi:SAM-dependent methyltransferase
MSEAPGRPQGALAVPSRPCPICGARARSGDAALEPRPLRCPACRLVYIDPLPAAALSPSSYGAAYYDPWQGTEEAARLVLWRRRLMQVLARDASGTLLDVGCGDGLFLRVARDAGLAVEGIEFSPEGARRAALRLGRPVAVGDLSRDRVLHGPFDVITLWHVLEHLPEPAAMLAAVRARLRPGGLLVVAVPNLDNLPLRLAYRLARGRPLPLYEEGAREPHLTHFSAATLSGALQRHGFVAVEVRPDRCALHAGKRCIDALAATVSRLTGTLLTDAIVAFARTPR